MNISVGHHKHIYLTAGFFMTFYKFQFHFIDKSSSDNMNRKLPLSSKTYAKWLTVEVEGDGAGDGCDQVVVGRLTGEHHVQVSSLHPLQTQHVLDPALAQHLVRVVQQRVLLPPRHSRKWSTCRHITERYLLIQWSYLLNIVYST